VGLLFGPTHIFSHYLEKMPYLPEVKAEHAFAWSVPLVSIAVVAAGIGLAWLFYVQMPSLPGRLASAFRAFYEASSAKFYVDEIYGLVIVGPLQILAGLCRIIDQYLVDGVVDLVGWSPSLAGQVFRPVQNGLVQFYALAMILGLAVFVVAMVIRLGG
jgi:NADH-quinone oxidoreductase subunit L